MKLIIAIIQDEYINKVVEDLMDNDIRTTKLSSTGGFLKSGNTTLLIGSEEEEVDGIVDIIRTHCGGEGKRVKSKDGQVKVGGANLFIIAMDRYLRI